MRTLYFILMSTFSATALASQIPGFVRVDSSYSIKKEESDIKMPRVTSQDGLGICYAHVAATLMQAENCRALKVDCSSLPESALFSPLALTRLRAPDQGEALPEQYGAYKGLNVDGGNNHNTAMIGALVVRRAPSEECLSLDRVLSKMQTRGETTEAQAAMWEGLRMQFETVKKQAQAKANCAECLNNIYATAVEKMTPEVEKNLNLKTDNVRMAQAFAAETYEKFLDEFLGAGQCRRPSQQVSFENYQNVKYETFPSEGSASPQAAKAKVKEVLKGGRPVALANLCLGNAAASQCEPDKLHSVVIAGYRTVCNSGGKCRDLFKVINSWGKSWQDQNDGGWLDADSILTRTHIRAEALGWFADKK